MPAPVIALTAGDPCGIGAEVILKALRYSSARSAGRWLVIGDHDVFARTAQRLRGALPPWSRIPLQQFRAPTAGATFLDCAHRARFHPGRASGMAGRASLDYLDAAVALWRQGVVHAIVTAPVTKHAIDAVHPGFVGQTEYLATACGAKQVAMMFVSDELRVVLLSRHVPMRDVARAVSRQQLHTTLRLTIASLRQDFQIRHPRMAICGLNPHAGEGGLLGDEERRLLQPVLRQLRRSGVACDGPFAADGFFAARHSYDAVVCWYHDQGLIPFKMLARDQGCQMTIGLPVIRTSPDHGSALDIAGQGRAEPGSMIYAIRLAAKLAGRTPRASRLSPHT